MRAIEKIKRAFSLPGAGFLLTGTLTFLLIAGGYSLIYGKVKTRLPVRELCLSCHQEVKEQAALKSVHFPFKEGECTACHSPHAARHAGLIALKPGALCYSCHSNKKEEYSKGIVHGPVRRGECVSCHNAHASKNKFMLTQEGGDLCFKCHSGLGQRQTQKVVHLPFGQGMCESCHKPHVSTISGLLTAGPKELCTSCHDPKDAALVRGHRSLPFERTVCVTCHDPHASDLKGSIKRFVHVPFAQGKCESCHRMAGERAGETVAATPDLCYGCHRGIQQQFQKAGARAPVALTQCGSCHAPHASDIKGLLKDEERPLCLSCHQDLERRIAKSPSVHPVKVAEGKCTACHTPHPTELPNLLPRKPIPLCASCHQIHATFSHPMGEKILDPRDKSELTCVSCHEPHGTVHKPMLRFARERELCIQCHKI